MQDGQRVSTEYAAQNRNSFAQSPQSPDEPSRGEASGDSKGRPLAAQLMFYENAVPVSRARHGNWFLERVADYTFCRNVNSVPLMAAEFSSAALEYAIVFAGSGHVVTPAVILGVRADHNDFVTEQGNWQAKYIPAFVRRYPFVFASGNAAGTFTLCIDEAFSGFNQDCRGERLFGEAGKPTPFIEGMLTFLQQYQSDFQRTQAFCRRLKELNLLEPMQARISIGAGARMTLRGFSVVSRARLKTLSSDVLAEMVNSGELELIYTHVVSMRNFSSLRERLSLTTMHPKRDIGNPDNRIGG